MMKKKLLFVNESLTLAGGEKSLLALLSNIDPNKYEIDLQLFKYGGELEQFLPDYVNILPPFDYTNYLQLSLKESMISLLENDHLKYLFARLGYSFDLRKGKFNTLEKAKLYWENVKRVIPNSKKDYDVAIAYAHGIPTYYVSDKIKAKKKYAWINVNLNLSEKVKEYNYQYYKNYDRLIAVSKTTKLYMINEYPDLEKKYKIIYDILDYKSIIHLSEFGEIRFENDKTNILTVARLNKNQKGYDITLEACRILKERNFNFHWYAIGEGSYRSEMEAYISKHGLEKHFSLLGTTPNPYPYFKAADIYVQTSRHEGYGISIAEARLLNLPIVTTRFDTVFEQMIDGKNGLVVDLNPEAIADGIQKLINDKSLYDSIADYLKSEPKENLESVKKFDRMISEPF